MAGIIKVSQGSFRSEVVESETPVLVDFWAEWCQPCLRMNPALEELSEEFDGTAKIAKVNVDEERALGAMFQVMSIPALMIFKDGEKIDEFTGVQDKETLRAALDRASSSGHESK